MIMRFGRSFIFYKLILTPFAENKKLLENARDQQFEIVKYFVEDKFQNDTRMQNYMIELEDQALLNWHLYLLRHFKSMEEPLVEGVRLLNYF